MTAVLLHNNNIHTKRLIRDESVRPHRTRPVNWNIQRIQSKAFPRRSVMKFKIDIHKERPNLSADYLLHEKHFLLFNSAKKFSRSLAAFDVLRSHRFLLYVIWTFEKYHIMHIGLIIMFTELTNTVIRRNCPLILTSLIENWILDTVTGHQAHTYPRYTHSKQTMTTFRGVA